MNTVTCRLAGQTIRVLNIQGLRLQTSGLSQTLSTTQRPTGNLQAASVLPMLAGCAIPLLPLLFPALTAHSEVISHMYTCVSERWFMLTPASFEQCWAGVRPGPDPWNVLPGSRVRSQTHGDLIGYRRCSQTRQPSE